MATIVQSSQTHLLKRRGENGETLETFLLPHDTPTVVPDWAKDDPTYKNALKAESLVEGAKPLKPRQQRTIDDAVGLQKPVV